MTAEGGRACTAVTPAAAPTARRGWHGVRPPPETPLLLPPPWLLQIRTKPHHHPQRAGGWEVEKGSEMDEPRHTRKRGMAAGGTGAWGRKGSWRLAQIAACSQDQALPRNPRPHSLPGFSLAEGDARSTGLARPPPPSAKDALSGKVGKGRQRKEH